MKFWQVFHLRPLTTSDALGTLVTLSGGMPHVLRWRLFVKMVMAEFVAIVGRLLGDCWASCRRGVVCFTLFQGEPGPEARVRVKSGGFA